MLLYSLARFDDTCFAISEIIKDRKTVLNGESFKQFYCQLKANNSIVTMFIFEIFRKTKV